jgi:uncharacterized glyoxalase superfamily protein PhnB
VILLANTFHGLIPVLPVVDVDAALAYYQDVLGFSIAGRHQDATGEVVFGSALCDGANFYFRRASGLVAANECMVYVDEVDLLCATFKSKGAEVLDEPADQPWGYRQFKLRDPNGHLLTFFRFSDGVE